jgi:hypothetical protein
MFSTLHLDGLHSLLYRQGKIINLCIQFYNILNEMGELLHYGQPNFKKKIKKKYLDHVKFFSIVIKSGSVYQTYKFSIRFFI